MLIEIHMIQNHSPSNLNRDDLGAPKTCMFGGVQRLRISSQCLKRSIRRSAFFQECLERDGGVRTRNLIGELLRRTAERNKSKYGDDEKGKEKSEKYKGKVKSAFEACGLEFENELSNVTLFLKNSTLNELALAAESNESGLRERFTEILKAREERKVYVPDIALSGRMIELDPKKPFGALNLNVDAALASAHAISTHEVTTEIDYFTLTDDDPEVAGAAHVDEAQFGSACFYKYFSVYWEQLLLNLGKENAGLAAATIGKFILAASRTVPSGKKNCFAAFNEPAGVLVEIKDSNTPTSYANAFAEPARRIGRPEDDTVDEQSLVGRSIAQFGDHVFNVRRTMSNLSSKLIWYTATPWKFPLRGWERHVDGRKASPVVIGKNPVDTLEDLVKQVVEKMNVGLTWSDVMQVGLKKVTGDK